ncbi:monothiol glutaredoxin-S17 [Micractinium conductrix]|uniref:Monothiol glutaredoxin-S17 n=1 Tax=Micractinium conductrix TaxID=554055 RepID=A0A2P6V3G1_9CHLO|nr:monothiol glutaredoxin-S17 [Micractinium conductrix]|eukprot:PSC68630.1 monothiol glutaredoxin-S17 [Micractinium conductrix]
MQSLNELADFRKALAEHRLAVVHFWAAWCEPCAFLDTVLKQLAADAPAVAVLRVEAEKAADISEAYNVSFVPYFLFFRDGKVVDSLEGADAPTLTTKFAALVGGGGGGGATQPAAEAPAAAQPASVEPAGGLQARLQQLVNQQPIMLFMKGSPDAPRCGFSRKVVEAIQQCGAQFGSFDILSDDGVRQGLKELSQWPTYPQLYLNGELLGGCDIVLEMAEAGELQSELAKAKPAAGAVADPKAVLRSRLEALVNQKDVMLFMKGTPEAPQCGFSRKVVDALQAAGEDFGSFNILTDEAVRQGLKEYSSWPTYPQVFVKGELLGGCDIVLEMAEAGELKDTIEEMKARM